MTDETPELSAELGMETVAHGDSPSWHQYVAFTTVALAALAAVASLLAGITAHEFLLERTEEIVDLAVASGDRSHIDALEAKHEVLIALGQPVDPAELAEIEASQTELAERESEALIAEAAATSAASTHIILAVAATLFGVSIAVTGLAVIVGRRWVWGAGGVVAAVGLAVLVVGLLSLVA